VVITLSQPLPAQWRGVSHDKYIRLSETASETDGVKFDDFDAKFPRMRGDIEAAMPPDKQLAALREYHDYLNRLKRQADSQILRFASEAQIERAKKRHGPSTAVTEPFGINQLVREANMNYVKAKSILRGNKLKMGWPRAWKIYPSWVTDHRGGTNGRPYEYLLDNGARWISHDRLKKVYVDPEEDPPPETQQDRDYYPFRQARYGLLVECPGSFITHGQQQEAVRCFGQDVGHLRLTSRAETVCWAGARPGTECHTAWRPVRSDTHRPATWGVSRSRGHAGECHGGERARTVTLY
jgi:hypothetical protein